MDNHVFERPCRNPSRTEVLAAADNLMHSPLSWGSLAANSITTLCDAFHGDAVAAGWHHNIETREPKRRNAGEMLMLAVSELAEAMEGHRKKLTDDKLPHRSMLEVELADYVIRVCDTMRAAEFAYGAVPNNPEAPYALDMNSRVITNVGERLLRIVSVTAAAYNHVGFDPHAPTTAENASENRRSAAIARKLLTRGLLMTFHLAGTLSLDLPAALVDKRDYNKRREDHSVSSRLAEGGKAY